MKTSIFSMMSISFFMAMLAVYALADSEISPNLALTWQERTYKTVAPEPFSAISFTVAVDDKDRVSKMTLSVGGELIEIDDAVYSGFTKPGEVEISYSAPSLTDSSEVEYVGFYFEVGDIYRLQQSDVLGCPSPCISTHRDIVKITLSSSYQISKKLISPKAVLSEKP